MSPAETYEYGRSDRGLRLENNANIRSMAHDAKRQKQLAAANLGATAANVGATIIDGIKTRQRLERVTASIEELSRDVSNQTDVIRESTRNVVDRLRENDDHQARRDYKLWVSSTGFGHQFHYDYRPKAEKFIDTVATAHQAWEMLVMDRVGQEVGKLTPQEQQCLRTGIYHPEPEEPLIPPEPEPEPEEAEIPGKWKRFLVGLMIFAIIMTATGIITAKVVENHWRDQDLVFSGTSLSDPPSDTEKRMQDATVGDLLDGTFQPDEYSVPYLSKEELADEERSGELWASGLALGIALIPAIIVSYIVANWGAVKREERIVSKIKEDNERASKDHEQSVKNTMENYTQDIAKWEQWNDQRLTGIHSKLSQNLGFDTRARSALDQWGRFNYVEHAQRVREFLDRAYQHHPLPDEYLGLPSIEINDTWFATGMSSEASRLQNVINSA
ncbi:MAG: hypothetical protein ACTHY6_12980 [Corynebacterium variabile]|uniref:hypothetical protein n=1 Tax=Corynebacterium variabile TaxID=1727 RepID=UPI003F9353DA